VRQSIIRESSLSAEENESLTSESNEPKVSDKNESKESVAVKNDEPTKIIDPIKQNAETNSKENISPAVNHTQHQKRKAPNPPQVIINRRSKDRDSVESNKVPEQENLIPTPINAINQNIDYELQQETVSSNNDNESVARHSLPNTESDENQTNEEPSDSPSSSGFEVTVSPNHSTIIKNSEDSNLDMSHVSIVTIDNNGKDVMIQTANEDNNSEAEILNLMNNSPTDEVVIVRNDEYPTSDKIVVTTEYVPSSDENALQKDVKKESEINADVAIHVPPHYDADDTISTHTSSSDNSANQNDNKPRIKVNLNLVSESEHEPYSDAYSADKSEYNEVSKTRLDQVPTQNDVKNKKINSNNRNSVPNGVFPSASPPVKSNAPALKRELSDSGSFFSISSDKENNNENENSQQNIILRKKREKVWICSLNLKLYY